MKNLVIVLESMLPCTFEQGRALRLLALLCAALLCTSAWPQGLSVGAQPQSRLEERDFLDNIGFPTKVESCHRVRESALNWIKENTETTNYYYFVNLTKRRWTARSGGVADCACDSSSTGFICRTTGRLVEVEGSASSSSQPKPQERSFLGNGFSQTSACDEVKNRAGAAGRQSGKSVRTRSCECDTKPGAVGSVVWQCRVDAIFE